MKEAIIILGAGVMQGPAINIAKELGYYAIALDGSSAASCVSLADRFEQIDLKAKEEIESFARSIQKDFNRIGIMTAGTDFSASVAWTAEKLGLPGYPYEAALNASDKSRMRECFKKVALPSPEFVIISKEEFTQRHKGHTLDYAREPASVVDSKCKTARAQINRLFLITASGRGHKEDIKYPAVIKPVDNMGSRGCRRIDNVEELEEALETALSFSRSGRAIVENYMDGPEFSVDAIVYKGEITICGLADRHIFFPPYFIEMGHTMPTVIENEKQESMLDTFCAGIKALGLCEKDNIGAAKGDIKLTAKGPMIGEIAARLSGGYMSGWTYPYSSGALPIKGAILAAMGQKPQGLTPIKKWTCAERAFISIPGTVKQITGIREQGSDNFVNNVFMRIKEGDKVAFPENNVTKCGNIIASAPDRETAIKAAEDAAKAILIRLDPSDLETGRFLTKAQTANRRFEEEHKEELSMFPPNAFELTSELQEALAQLPENLRISTTNHTNHTNLQDLWIPFPAFENSGLRDYMNRTVYEVLEAVRVLCAANLRFDVSLCEPLSKPSENAENVIRLGRSFWAALIRGSYQGAVFYIDTLGAKIDKEENH